MQSIAFKPGFFSDKIHAIREELKSYILLKSEESKIRSKANYLDNAEKPTRFFLRKEVVNANNKVIGELHNGNDIVHDRHDLEEVCTSFYSDLYKLEAIDD